MIIGDGAIANRFASYDLQSDYLVFAGGLHNSSISNQAIIDIEEDAVKDALDIANNERLTFVYFSSCSINDIDLEESLYVSHKARMEQLVRSSPCNFLIFRLPQIIGLTNIEGGLCNELVKAIALGNRFKLWQAAVRNFIDLDDVYSIVHKILLGKIFNNEIINVANPFPTPVPDLVKLLEGYFGRQGNYDLVPLGTSYTIDTSKIKIII